MKYQLLSTLCAIATLAAVSGCGHSQSVDFSNMDKAQQEAAFKADPSKMPESVRQMMAQQHSTSNTAVGGSN